MFYWTYICWSFFKPLTPYFLARYSNPRVFKLLSFLNPMLDNYETLNTFNISFTRKPFLEILNLFSLSSSHRSSRRFTLFCYPPGTDRSRATLPPATCEGDSKVPVRITLGDIYESTKKHKSIKTTYECSIKHTSAREIMILSNSRTL